jgi:predicted acyltransferase
MSSDKPRSRIISMDQFRGYTVAGMFLVNFVGSYAVVRKYLPGIPHGDGYFAYADSIMPAFMFCAGFSYRLTALRRFSQLGTAAATWSYFRRSLALVGISLVIFGLGTSFEHWSDMTADSVSNWLWELIKADLWEVLSIIGVSQILLLPVINRSFRVRLSTAIGLLLGYILMNYSFDYSFQEGHENWMNGYFGADGRRSWDGGFFGPLAWAIPMLSGTLVFDVISSRTLQKSMQQFLLVGALLMIAGYGVSCLTRLYDRVEGTASETGGEHADDPVWPRTERWTNPGIGWAEPPFFARATTELRQHNFWMMKKRIMTPSYILFSIGFGLFLYALFIAASDLSGLQFGLFRTLGQNPLAAYIIHELTMHCIKPIVPKDSDWWWVAASFSAFFVITWSAVKYMENNKLYLRL